MNSTLTLKKINLLRTANVSAAMYAIMGVVLVPFMLGGVWLREKGSFGALMAGNWGLLLIPFLYLVMGYVCGLLGAALYNVVSTWTGGYKFEVSSDEVQQPK